MKVATILVVDDHPMNREFLITLLGYQKHHLFAVSDGLKALEIIRKESIDLVISDILMPHLNGYELAKAIRSDSRTSKVPVIFYTATYNSRDAQLLASAIGVEAVIPKPSDPQEILDQVNTILGIPLCEDRISIDSAYIKETSRLHACANLSICLDQLDTTNQYITQLAEVEHSSIEGQACYEALRLQIQKMRDTNLKMSEIMKLGFSLMAERDPLRMFKLFSHTVCNIMNVHSVTIGVVDDIDCLSGLFCTTTRNVEGHSHYFSDTCLLADSVLRPLVCDQDIIRISKLNKTQLIESESTHSLLNRTFLGVPIVSMAEKAGVLYFTGKCEAQAFTEEDARIATTMGSKLALLYESINQHDRLQQQALKLEIEIIERKKIESDLRFSENRLQLALGAGQMQGWELNINTQEVYKFGGSDSLATHCPGLSNYTMDQALKNMDPEDREKMVEAVKKSIEQGTDLITEFRSHRPDGPIEWVAVHGQVFSDRQGIPNRMVGVSAVITERKREAELARQHHEELAHLARINSMGEMASTLAHELNQPLTVINTYLSGCILRLEQGKSDPAAIIQAMKKAMQNVTLAGEIIHRMKNFVRQGKLHYEKISMSDVIKEALSLIQDDIKDIPLTIHLDFTEDLPLIDADKVQIMQVLSNLIRNSVDAVRAAKTGHHRINIATEKSNSHAIMVRIKDSGVGIKGAINNVMFTPYFTTKADGMGMGLSICRTIIEAHGGQLSATNLPEGGACFQFTLPIAYEESYA